MAHNYGIYELSHLYYLLSSIYEKICPVKRFFHYFKVKLTACQADYECREHYAGQRFLVSVPERADLSAALRSNIRRPRAGVHHFAVKSRIYMASLRRSIELVPAFNTGDNGVFA
jgi:hypothetical protein